MKISKIQNLLKGEVLTSFEFEDRDIAFAFGSDLMSDVLRFSMGKGLLVTGLTNVHAIRTAEMAEYYCILFVRGKVPTADIIEEANEEKIILLQTEYTMYESCGILFSSGLTNGIDTSQN